jgi:hypothetical protein
MSKTIFNNSRLEENESPQSTEWMTAMPVAAILRRLFGSGDILLLDLSSRQSSHPFDLCDAMFLYLAWRRPLACDIMVSVVVFAIACGLRQVGRMPLPRFALTRDTNTGLIGVMSMNRTNVSIVVALSFLASQGLAQTQLPTLEEAVKISKETGKPIFAMAGQKT